MELHSIRSKVREALPSQVFEPQPLRGIMAIALIPVTITLFWTIIALSPPWYVCLGISLIIGEIFTVWGFIAHEALHGFIFRSEFGQNFLGYLGYVTFFISPLTWKFWHCQCHHGFTNFRDKDPDFIGTIESFSQQPITRLRALFTPGNHKWFSYIGLFCLFTLEGQYVLWFYEVGTEVERKFGFKRNRAKLETILIFGFWILLGITIGAKASLYTFIIPMLIGNFIYVSYILTQHLLRPTNNGQNDPLENTITVTINPALAFLHLHFGYHVEHHLFPSMCHNFGPQVSEVLRQYCGKEYISIPYLEALWLVFNTPRIHLDAQTLVNPYSGEQFTLSDVMSKMTISS